MTSKDDFEFLNSTLWLKYTQERYAPIDDIKYRLESLGHNKKDWESTKNKIQYFRKMGSIPLFLKSIDKKFWFFMSDAINKKIHEIEHRGTVLFEKIERHGSFKQEFLSNASIEEAITSAIYEGANTTRSKAKELIATKSNPKSKDEWMLINNYKAMKWIKEHSTLKLSKEVALKIHEIVTTNTLEGDDVNFCGKFRNDTVSVGSHTGVNWKQVESAFDEVIDLTTNNPRYLHPLLRGIIIHYFTAYIHPFFDGNGRTARTLFYFKAIKNNLKFVELLSVSANLKELGKKYEKSFDLVKQNDLDISYFVDFCLDSLLQSLKKVEHKVNYLIDVSKIQKKLQLTNNQISLLQRMALHKYKAITIDEYALQIGKSREISRRELKKLVEIKLLYERKIGKKFFYLIDTTELKKVITKETK